MRNPRREIELYIDELVLEGVALSERHAVAEALKLELENLLRESCLAFRSDLSAVQIDRLNAGSITVKAPAHSNRLGAQLGQALFQSLNSLTPADRPSRASVQDNNSTQPVQSDRSERSSK